MSSNSAYPLSDFRMLFRAGCIAFIVEFLTLTAVGWHAHWLAHPQKTKGLDPSAFVEAQMVQLPEETHLSTPEPVKEVRKEVAISKEVDKGRKAKEEEKKAIDQETQNQTNQTSPGGSMGATHGPVAVYTPAPVLPSYLLNEDLKRTVVVEFYITAQGAVMPRLLSSSDNEELDALALATVKKWQFRPAEKDHKAIDAKVRLRIEFEVH